MEELIKSAIAAAIIGLGLFALVAFDAKAGGYLDEDPKPVLITCDADVHASGLLNRKWTCKNVVDFGPTNPDDYGHSNKDPKDPSNDPRRNHNER